eukprot:1865765-Prymnesium_polylepis.2
MSGELKHEKRPAAMHVFSPQGERRLGRVRAITVPELTGDRDADGHRGGRRRRLRHCPFVCELWPAGGARTLARGFVGVTGCPITTCLHVACGRWPMLWPKAVSGDYACPAVPLAR